MATVLPWAVAFASSKTYEANYSTTPSNFPATLPKTNQPDRALRPEEIEIILNALGGRDALIRQGLNPDNLPIILTDRILPDGTLLPRTPEGRPDLSRAPPQIQEETRRGIALLTKENNRLILYLHHDILKIPAEQLKIILEGHELFHLLNPEASEAEAREYTVRYLIEHNFLSSQLDFLKSNQIGLVPEDSWLLHLQLQLIILAYQDKLFNLLSRYHSAQASMCSAELGLRRISCLSFSK